MKHALERLAEASWQSVPVPQELELMGHAAIIGTALMLVLYWASKKGMTKKEGKGSSPSDVVLASSNVLFMTFGMAAVMLLVNNNLARAFAIGAAIALIRFRIKVDNKTLGMSILYGVIAGMACGIGEVATAYAILAFFACLQFIVVGTATTLDRRHKKSVIAEVPQQPIIVVEQKPSTQTFLDV